MTSAQKSPAEVSAGLARLYEDFAAADMVPLWTARDDLMPMQPTPRSLAHLWRWSVLYPLAQRAGDLVPVGRGGERRAIALANPTLGGEPYATPTLWAAIQYLGPREVAPEHRHSQNAFRFVLEGEGVWTVVDGDPVAMRRGDLLITAGGRFHGHHNATDQPMAWLDGLDIPLQSYLDSTFFQFGSDEVTDYRTPSRSQSELLWAHPGLAPVGAPTGATAGTAGSVLAAYRWTATDAALTDLLTVGDEGRAGWIEPGHAAIRYTDPATGQDVLPTIRCEIHRIRGNTTGVIAPAVGSSVWQVFDGAAIVRIGVGENAVTHEVERGDVFVVPSWAGLAIEAGAGTDGESGADADFFCFSDAPVIEKLGLARALADRAE
jgi:gentisate 1,2-dioxygenase